MNSRKKQKKVRVFFLLVLFFVGNYYLGNLINDKVNHEIESYTLTNLDILRTSGYWNLPPFVIDDSATGVGAQNWTWAETQLWCSGSGTFEDPYLIENVTIDGGNSGNCITIKNSNKYFRIENCTVFNSGSEFFDAGIYLYLVEHGTFINNNCSFNSNYGIYLYDSDNTTVSGNTANNNSYRGIEIYDSDNTTVAGNTASNNQVDGIRLYHSDNNTVSGNTANNNSNYGITIYSSDHNTVAGNTANNHSNRGIYLYQSDSNIVSGNTANNNSYRGIGLGLSNSTTVSGNIVDNNVNYGIIIESGNYNLIYKNYFYDNGNNAYDNGTDNNWDNGVIGNYWDDYDGVDANDDGIGDTPYLISGTGSQDNFPIWDDGDDIPPVITIIFPLPDSVFDLVAPNYNISIDELNLDAIWYTLDGGITNYTITGLTGTFNQTAWEVLNEGSITIWFYANDTAGNVGSAVVTVKKDISAPVITIIFPLPDEVFGLVAPNYNISIDEFNLDAIWYTLDGGITNYTITSLTGPFNQTAWGVLNEGNVTIRFYASDALGRIGYQEVTIVKRIPQSNPPGIPGYDLLSLLGIVSVVAIVIIKKRYGSNRHDSINKSTNQSF
ncbi:MAG: right-handed parallel beta-helix repeat-containing protein [Candidatus Lokiarchaeota archaeon]|nr:right-handed parallel beta-helix repeat-containing protein [Candidatus Lokiarchaeota archaeon]